MENARVVDEALLQKLIELRKDVHKHPEPGFKEVRTQGVIKKTLIEAGVDPSAIKVIKGLKFSSILNKSPQVSAGTGLVVDIKGTGEPRKEGHGGISMIALRADIDALQMTEANHDLPHRSVQ